MAEVAYGFDPDAAPARGNPRMARLANMVGAVTSVALLAGIGWWGYRLAVLDVSGVPVLQAVQGPMRVAPADPGGKIAAHAGLSVNAVLGGSAAPGAADRVALAPEPVRPMPEDLVRASAPAPAATVIAPAAPDADAALRAAVDEALAAAIGPEALPAPAAAAGDGLARSPRPRPRPGSAAAAGEGLASLGIAGVRSLSSGSVTEIAPAAIRPGTRLAQIGAYDSVEAARADWDRIAARAGVLMDGKARVLQPATSAGRDFVRMRVASFESEDDARRFCAALDAPDLRCVPVTHR